MQFHQDIDSFLTPRDGAVTGFEEKMLRRLMKSEEGLVLVALDGRQAVGYSLSEISNPGGLNVDNVGLINHLAITEDFRRSGVGDKMLDEILKWFRSRSIDRVELDVLTKNQVGYSFWKKHGFTDFRHRLFKQI
jgi:ribosomal protein S18 acetylase RimI-like enzyme